MTYSIKTHERKEINEWGEKSIELSYEPVYSFNNEEMTVLKNFLEKHSTGLTSEEKAVFEDILYFTKKAAIDRDNNNLSVHIF